MSVHATNLKRGYIVNEDNDKKMTFQFNPEEFYTEHSATFETIDSPGSSYPNVFYGGRKLERIPLTLYFHTRYENKGKLTDKSKKYSSNEIEDYFKEITLPAKKQKNMINGSNHFISPPMLTFGFGRIVYSCVCESAKIVRKMFNSKLQTIMLQVDITLIRVAKRSNPSNKAKTKATKKTTKKSTKTTNKSNKKNTKKYYTIKKNDKYTLTSFAKKYGLTKSKLIKLNKTIKKKLDSNNHIKVGTKVRYK